VYQDSLYGAGRRLHNPCKDGKARCTVCGTIKNAPVKKEDSKEKKK